MKNYLSSDFTLSVPKDSYSKQKTNFQKDYRKSRRWGEKTQQPAEGGNEVPQPAHENKEPTQTEAPEKKNVAPAKQAPRETQKPQPIVKEVQPPQDEEEDLITLMRKIEQKKKKKGQNPGSTKTETDKKKSALQKKTEKAAEKQEELKEKLKSIMLNEEPPAVRVKVLKKTKIPRTEESQYKSYYTPVDRQESRSVSKLQVPAGKNTSSKSVSKVQQSDDVPEVE